jgi:transcription elongation GreA/GreB family factor
MSHTRKITTAAGLSRLQTRVEEVQARLADLLASKADAAENGGNQWHDNASFEELERNERILRRQIADLSRQLDHVVVVDDEPGADGRVGLGTTVTLRFEDGTSRAYEIRGFGESDPTAGIVSCDAPLGRAVMGAGVGDTVSFTVGTKERSVVVEVVR